MAVAEASFSTSIDSMSEGASVESGLVVVIVVKLGSDGPSVNLEIPAVPTGTPSITYSGWLSPVVEVTPRICTAMAPPGAASPCVTVAPGALPCSACCRLTTAVFCSWSGGTDATAPVRSALRWVPYPTTTTSDRVTAIGWIAKFSVTICPAVTATVSSRAEKPIRLARDRKSTRLNSSHSQISYAVFCLKKKKQTQSHRFLTSDDSDPA